MTPGSPRLREYKLLLSYVPGENSPLAFYEKCGYVETGKWQGEEKEMKLVL